jgi:hypothetical protein
MTKVLSRGQLVDIRDGFLDLISWSLTRRDTLENQRTITREESEMIGQYEAQVSLIANSLDSVILRQVIADIDEPGKRIVAVTKDLEAAIGTLQSLNDFIGVLAAVLSLATTILTAYTTGNPLVLVNVLDQIEALI